MANKLIKDTDVFVYDWRLVDSDGDGLFDYFSDYYSMDNVTIFDGSPANNYAGRSLLISFIGSAADYKQLKKERLLSLSITTKGADSTTPSIYLTPVLSEFPAFSKNLAITFASVFSHGQASAPNGTVSVTLETDLAEVLRALNYGVLVSGDGRLSLRDTVVIARSVSPYAIQASSRVPSKQSTANINDPITFSWQLSTDTSQIDNPAQENIVSTVLNYKLYWRDAASSTDGVLLYTGTDTAYTAPANTFDGHSQIQWRVVGTMSNGVSINPYAYAETDDPDDGWFTLKLADLDAKSTCKIIYPNNVSVDGASSVLFEWQHVVSTGTAQTRADIQTGSTPDQLTDFATIQGDANTYSAPANSFTAGDLYWRVRTYNADGVAGEWSETAHIIVISASPAPLLILERISPRPIIRWETVGQVSYEVEIVGVESAQQYGSGSRYEGKTILAEGLYTIRVRIQNQYSLWSPWAEASLTVFNDPGGAITLSATASKTGEVQLSWSTTGTFTSYQILRNGAVIGETTERSYLDRLAIGACSYQIRGIVDSAGNYSLSNVQALTVTVPTVEITPVSGGDWLALPYSTTDIREVSVSVSKTVTYQQFLGASLPVGVVGEALSKSVQLSCAFPYRLQADAAKLEALIGQLVCVKDPRGRRYLGILGSMSHVSSRFYLSYNLTITPVACEEVDL